MLSLVTWISLTCKYRIHETNISRVYGSEKRRNDYIYCRMKILNAEWFDTLSLETKQLFFLDLLTSALSGNMERQKYILGNEKFLSLPVSVRSFLWRSVGIDILQSSQNIDEARSCFQESLNSKSDDRKTRFLLSGLSFGRPFVMTFIKLWRLLLQIRKRFDNSDHTQSPRLQKLLGVR